MALPNYNDLVVFPKIHIYFNQIPIAKANYMNTNSGMENREWVFIWLFLITVSYKP